MSTLAYCPDCRTPAGELHRPDCYGPVLVPTRAELDAMQPDHDPTGRGCCLAGGLAGGASPAPALSDVCRTCYLDSRREP
jgi:hypothetical protein